MKTVRFTEVVRHSGQPHVHTLWLAPEKDPELARARKTDRIMTVGASDGAGKTEVGFVGFDPAKHPGAQFLIFPKSLQAFEGARVVGIKFDLIEQPKLVPATPAKKRAAPPPKAKRPAKPAAPGRHVHARIPTQPEEPAPPPAREARRLPQRGRPPRQTAAPPKVAARKNGGVSADEPELLREVRQAIEEIADGKPLAAYRRLRRAVGDQS